MSWPTGPAGTDVSSSTAGALGSSYAEAQSAVALESQTQLPPPLPPPAEGPQNVADQPQDVPYGGSTGDTKLSALAALPASQIGPSYRLTVHGIDGSLGTASSVAPLVRMHVVDIDTGNWKWKVSGESRATVYNVDAAGKPYFRMTPRRQEPWQADIGQSPYIRPFATMPCHLKADRMGVVRTPPVWNEQFLITEPLNQDTMILFEVLYYVEEKLAGSEVGDSGHAHCVALAWAFLDVEQASILNTGRRRLRLQLHRYRRSRLGMGWFARRQQDNIDWLEDMADASIGLTASSEDDDSRARPRVYSELRRPARPAETGHVRKFLRSAAEMLFSRRHNWPAVLEVTLQKEEPKGELDKVAEALLQELNVRRAHAGGPSPGAQEISPTTLTTADVTAAAGEASKTDLSQEEKSCLAPHNTRYRDQPCDLPTDLLWQIPTGERGASRLSVSPSGQLLAVAVSRRSGAGELRIFRILTGRVHAVCVAAHDAMVYDMCWHTFSARGATVPSWRNTSPPLLISCSGDGVVQVYEVPEDFRILDDAGMPMPTTPMMLRPHATLYLPSHVYSVRPHPTLSADPAQVVLVCGGHDFGLMICKVERQRIPEGPEVGRWIARTPHRQERVRLENPGNQQPPPQQADILCVRFSMQPTSPDNLYATDSAGHVSLFQVRFDALDGVGGSMRGVFVRRYSAPELAGVPIYSMEVITPQLTQGKRFPRMRLSNADDWVLIFSRDHIVRMATLSRGTLTVEQKYTGHESGNFPVRGTMSPDGCYVACGSETGEVLVWNASDGKPVPPSTFPEVQLAGPVMDTVWSEHHHVVACCALDDEAPPALVFVGGDPNRVPPKQPPRPPDPLPVLQPSRPPLPLDDVARDLREQFALVPKSIAPAGSAHEWAERWLNSNDNPRSAVTFDEKRQLKEKILGQLLDKKGAVEREQLFAGVQGPPGGIV